MQSKAEVIALFERLERDPHRQGNQVRISFLDYERLQSYKASLFRDGGQIRFVGTNRNVDRNWSPGVWTVETEDGFAKAHLVLDWQRDSPGAFVTIELDGEPVWIDRKPFRADFDQTAAIWATLPTEVKDAYRRYAEGSEMRDFILLVQKLDNYNLSIDNSDLQTARSDRDIVEEFLADFDEDDDKADISVEDWKALDDFKQSLSLSPDDIVFDTPRPEEDREWWQWKFESRDGFVHGAFIFDRLPSFFATISLRGEPFWREYDINESNTDQIRAIYAMLPEEAKEHLQKVATPIDPKYYQTMIDYLCPNDPSSIPTP